MARPGVTQDQVNAAADALLLAGERPTIDRVRQSLGTGSPNTLIKLLDAWWSDVGRRLTAQAAKVALPSAPASVVDAATALWVAALEQASAIAAAAIKRDQEDLERERTLLAEQAAESEDAAEQAHVEAQRARDAQTLSDTRLQDLQRLVVAQEVQLSELGTQREMLTKNLSEAIVKAESSEAALIAYKVLAASQRDALETQYRLSEARWLQEVDRARQETVKLQEALRRLEADAVAGAQRAQKDADTLRTSLREAERAQIASSTQVDALEREIARLHEQLSGTRRVNRGSPRKSGSKTSGPAKRNHAKAVAKVKG